MEASLFPIFVKLAGRPTLVVGAGAVAETKVESLLRARARVMVVAPAATPQIRSLAERGEIAWRAREFRPDDVAGHVLVFAATGVPQVDREVFEVSRRLGVPCNAVDDPEFCDFYSPAVVRRGDLQIAISTSGRSPALAQQIRRQLEQQFDAAWEQRVDELGAARRGVLASMPRGPHRTARLHEQARAALRGERPPLLARARDAVQHWLNSDDEKVALI